MNSGELRFTLDKESSLDFREQIREQLIHLIHFSLIAAGARLPTVRQLAAQCRVNLKTAFKIYRSLAQEGLVEIRPQSGVFVRSRPPAVERRYRQSVTHFLERVAEDARKYRLSEERLVHLLAMRAGLRNHGLFRCAVLECNPEQTRLFAREIRREVGVIAQPVELNAGEARLRAAVSAAHFLVTTDFHWAEVLRLAGRLGKEVFRVALNPEFHRKVIAEARRGPLGMILTDTSFEPRFRKALEHLVSPRVVERIRLVRYRDRKQVRRLLEEVRSVYVSPLCAERVGKLPGRVRRVEVEQMLSSDSLHELRNNLLFYPLSPKSYRSARGGTGRYL